MTFQEVERSKFKKSEKVKKDVSGGGEVKVKKIRKNDEKRPFGRWRSPSSKNPKKK
jgi:hypothetical protein